VAAIADQTGAGVGDLVLLVADSAEVVARVLGRLRGDLGERLGLADPNEVAFCWVREFPMFEWNAEEQRHQATHNPFSSPRDADLALLMTNPTEALAKQYDVIWNGNEVGGGSIRINRRAIQEQVFRTIGLSEAEMQEQFGHMLEAFDFGAPPHGGIALGLDRVAMLLAKETSIREVIAFPKNQSAVDPLMDAPSAVDARQLAELHLRVVE
jgi:aspartyl-tRNA synthetase